MRDDKDQTTCVGVAPATGTAGPLSVTPEVMLADQVDELVGERFNRCHSMRSKRAGSSC